MSPRTAPAVTERTGRSPRWGFMAPHRVTVGGRLFLKRRQVIQCPLFSVLVTRILRPDEGRDPHDHSRWFCSLAFGSYTEVVFTDPADLSRTAARVHWMFSVHVMPPDRAHLITRVSPRLRTFVFAGRHRGTWSFWTPSGPVDWRDYGAAETEGEPW